MKRIIAITLTLAQLAALAACGSENTGNSGETNTAEPSSEATTAAPEFQLELEPRSFGGRKFTFLSTGWYGYTPLDFIDIKVDEANGEVLNDAANDRLIAMRDKYDCEVEMVATTDAAKTLEQLSQVVLAGDDAYDVVMMRGTNISTAITADYLTDLSTVDHLDFDKPWWDANFRDTMTFSGKNYAAIGFTTTNHMNSVWVTCFNKQLIEDYKLDNPYKLVEDGKWTFEKMISMGEEIANDINGDTVMDDKDLWGVHYTRDAVIGFLNSSGVNVANINSDGEVELVIDSEKSVDRMLNILTKLFDTDYSVDYLSKNYQIVCFTENRALFHYSATHSTTNLRDMEIDFGMLPYPKYSEKEDYASATSGIFLSMTTIPASVVKADEVGYFLEAFAYEGYNRLKSAYYDNILTRKVARDNESAEMLDYIYANLEYDVGNLLNIGSFVSSIGNLSVELNTDVASFLASKLPAVEIEVEKFNAAMKK